MSVAFQTSRQTCRVLAEDEELAEAVPAAHRQRAVGDCVALSLQLPPGPWPAHEHVSLGEGIGLLMLEGLLLRRVGIDGRFGAELLGQGDLLRPWQGEEESPTLQVTTGWRVLEPVRLAVLDERFAYRLAPYPQVNARLIGRVWRRAQNLAVNMAIVHQARVEVRLQMVLWHLAARWGRVTSRGILLPLRLTHAVLADLVAAQRPTVSSALSELQRRGLVESDAGAWLLKGDPPGELLEVTPIETPA